MAIRPITQSALPGVLLAALAACSPTIKVQAPDKPIVINLNVNIRQEVVVKLERDVLETLRQNPNIF
jgi:hypothetical protein